MSEPAVLVEAAAGLERIRSGRGLNRGIRPGVDSCVRLGRRTARQDDERQHSEAHCPFDRHHVVLLLVVVWLLFGPGRHFSDQCRDMSKLNESTTTR